jgi:hypothetical protein
MFRLKNLKFYLEGDWKHFATLLNKLHLIIITILLVSVNRFINVYSVCIFQLCHSILYYSQTPQTMSISMCFTVYISFEIFLINIQQYGWVIRRDDAIGSLLYLGKKYTLSSSCTVLFQLTTWNVFFLLVLFWFPSNRTTITYFLQYVFSIFQKKMGRYLVLIARDFRYILTILLNMKDISEND